MDLYSVFAGTFSQGRVRQYVGIFNNSYWQFLLYFLNRFNPLIRLRSLCIYNLLNISITRPEDAGTYTCVANNSAGKQTVDMTLTVQGIYFKMLT